MAFTFAPRSPPPTRTAPGSRQSASGPAAQAPGRVPLHQMRRSPPRVDGRDQNGRHPRCRRAAPVCRRPYPRRAFAALGHVLPVRRAGVLLNLPVGPSVLSSRPDAASEGVSQSSSGSDVGGGRGGNSRRPGGPAARWWPPHRRRRQNGAWARRTPARPSRPSRLTQHTAQPLRDPAVAASQPRDLLHERPPPAPRSPPTARPLNSPPSSCSSPPRR